MTEADPIAVSISAVTFTLFPLLPPEVRLAIWGLTFTADFVPIDWSPTKRVFTSDRKPPSVLSVNQESRVLGLAHYKLSFAPSPEFARVFFDFERDVLDVNWFSLGPTPGRLGIGRKILREEVQKIGCLVIDETQLLDHAREGMRELWPFYGLVEILVCCDDDLQQRPGIMFGLRDMMRFAQENAREGDEWWPEIHCLVERDTNTACSSRHWWHPGWNRLACKKQKMYWWEAMSECLLLTCAE